MTDAEKIVMVKAMTDETDEDVISAFLSKAGEEIYLVADPYKTSDKDDVLEEYGGVQADAAAYYINKRGWDFQTAHSENGVSRTYESGGLPDSILRRITPKAGVVS